jgi:DNA-binding MarR family transcriptional regulator
MISATDGLGETSLPALLRAARATYAVAVREALTAAGFDDLSRNGPYVIGAIAHAGAPLSRIIMELGVTKQAAGQLVDALVGRGYLERSVDIEDRRRLTVTLTERGRAAAAVSRSAVERVDAELARTMAPEFIAHTRATLAAIAHVKRGTDRPADD